MVAGACKAANDKAWKKNLKTRKEDENSQPEDMTTKTALSHVRKARNVAQGRTQVVEYRSSNCI